ncbi:uncharacterized protein LOC128682099 isoform X2 [Plodia interpunctella]|uniref:uncharacterized protein LOC128682099 isoform X2 n=1 Tax=Plodia interpunctella TaxID=58824 RepID=UPI002367C9BC|nr:uncharacterized protein LOC128682099 isoform X2 [Plodia interpunctella]
MEMLPLFAILLLVYSVNSSSVSTRTHRRMFQSTRIGIESSNHTTFKKHRHATIKAIKKSDINAKNTKKEMVIKTTKKETERTKKRDTVIKTTKKQIQIKTTKKVPDIKTTIKETTIKTTKEEHFDKKQALRIGNETEHIYKEDKIDKKEKVDKIDKNEQKDMPPRSLWPFLGADYNKTMKKLDGFSMKRKKTHFQIPKVAIGFETRDVPMRGDINNKKEYDLDNNTIDSDIIIDDSNINDATPFISGEKYDDIGKTAFDMHGMISQIFTRQKELVTKLESYLLREKSLRSANKDFDKLLDSLEKKDNRNTTLEVKLEVTTKPPKMIPVVRTVIDASDVKKILSKDPYVQRILSLNKRRRVQYEKMHTTTSKMDDAY